MRNRKWQTSAWSAEDGVLTPSAPNADRHSSINLLGQEWPVVLNVQVDLEREVVRISSAGRSLWFASSAGKTSASPLPIPLDVFVRLLARLPANPANGMFAGKVGSPSNINSSIHHENGKLCVPLCGSEINELARDAAKFTTDLSAYMKSTTSEVGSSTQTQEQTLKTWSCFVSAAISGFIPEPMQSASSCALSVEITQGYTLLPARKGMAADGPRYRALGNSMAVPVLSWLGRRIAKVDADMQRVKEAT
jgi:hypothetical protein